MSISISTNLSCHRGRSAQCSALAFALVLASAPLRAAVSEADADSAKKLYADGVQLESTDLPTARDRFKGAFKLRPSPIIALKLGEVHEKLGELVEARQVYRRAESVKADEFLDVGVKAESPNALAARTKAHARAESLEQRIPTIAIRLEGVAKGASPKVSVDGVEIPVEALAVSRSVNPGKHVVVVAIAGQPSKKSAFELVEKERRVVTVDLTPDAPAGPATPVTATPREPTPRSSVPSSAPSTGLADAGVRSGSGGPGTLTWLGFGVGGAGLVIGGVTGLVAAGKASRVKENCPNELCPPAYHDDLGAAKGYSTVSTIGFGVGLLGIGVGIWGLVSGASVPGAEKKAAAPSGSATVQPWIGVGAVGVKGAF